MVSLSYSDIKGMFSDIVKLMDDGNNIEAQKKIVALQYEVLDLEAMNLELREKNSKLQEALDLKETVKHIPPFYYRISTVDGEEVKDGPFCQPCYDKDKTLIRLMKGQGGHMFCYVCKFGANPSDY